MIETGGSKVLEGRAFINILNFLLIYSLLYLRDSFGVHSNYSVKKQDLD